MTDPFDPYHVWLGIPPEQQPPNHYRLLAIELFENSPDVIASAADRQMVHLRTFQTGKHAAESQKLLNQVAAAKVCLLDPKKKAVYDQQLRQRLQPSVHARNPPEARSLDLPRILVAEPQDHGQNKAVPEHGPKKARPNSTVLIATAAAAAVLVLGLSLWWALGGGRSPTGESLTKADVSAAAKPAKELSPKPQDSPAKKASGVAAVSPKEEPKPDALTAAKPPEKADEQPKTPLQEAKVAEPQVSTKDLLDEKPKSHEPKEASAIKVEPPPSDEQKRLIAAIDELYKPGDAKDQGAKAALARKLLEEGQKSQSNRAEQFVLLRRAGEIAQDAGEAELMLEAVDGMAAAGFNIQPFQVKARLLKRMVEGGLSGEAPQRSAVSDACVKFAEEAAAGGAVEEASDVLAAAQHALAEPRRRTQQALRTARMAAARTRKPTDKAEQEKKVTEAEGELQAIEAALGSLAECAKGLEQARREQEAISAALERLKTQPDDPDTCLTVGRWQCFYKGDWDEGLKLLAKASDEALKKLAMEELASKPSKAEDKVARGDSWWDLAEKATGKAKTALRQRAGHWYQEALPELASGLVKSKLEKRLTQVPEEETPQPEGASEGSRPPLAVVPFDAQKAKEHQEAWAKYLRLPVETTNAIGIKLVLIPPGEFTMGEGGDAHKVTITKPFYLGKYEVTQEEWAAVMGSNPSAFKGPKNPVEKVSWDDCQVFLNRLNEMAGAAQRHQRKRVKGSSGAVRGSYALPTEAQWEYACRAGSTGRWYFGDREDEFGGYSWQKQNSEDRTHPVGEKKPNAWGLCDMYGNVWEWCTDWFDKDYYKASPGTDPLGPPSGSQRVHRGGCWNQSPGVWGRSAARHSRTPGERSADLGFRVCVALTDR